LVGRQEGHPARKSLVFVNGGDLTGVLARVGLLDASQRLDGQTEVLRLANQHTSIDELQSGFTGVPLGG